MIDRTCPTCQGNRRVVWGQPRVGVSLLAGSPVASERQEFKVAKLCPACQGDGIIRTERIKIMGEIEVGDVIWIIDPPHGMIRATVTKVTETVITARYERTASGQGIVREYHRKSGHRLGHHEGYIAKKVTE